MFGALGPGSLPEGAKEKEVGHVGLDESCKAFVASSVNFLRHWPIQELLQHPKSCMFHYFNRGQVLVRDSNNSDWIYIVKSGSLSVLKKLRQVQAKKHHKDEDQEQESPRDSGRTTWRQRASKHAQKNRKHTKDDTSKPEVFRNQIEADRRLEHSLPGVFNAKDRLGVVDYDKVISEYRSRVVAKPGSEPQTLRLPKIPGATHGAGGDIEEEEAEKGEEEDAADADVEDAEDEEEGDEMFNGIGEGPRPISKTSKGVYLSSRASKMSRQQRRRRQRRKGQTQQDDISDAQEAEAETDQGVAEEQESPADRPAKDTAQAEIDRRNIDYQRRFRERVGRKTLADQLDYKGARDFRYSLVDLSPMYVLVQVLERGQYFGMSQMIYPDQPSLCLVSNGAELIVLSKKLFLEKASETCMRHCRLSESPYPADEALQGRLQEYVNWEAHRARVYRRLVTDIRDRQSRRKQYLPSMPGYYSFRSGPL